MKEKSTAEQIAVIGMAGRFPGANNLQEFWNNIIKGKETISKFSDKELLNAGISSEQLANPEYIKAKGIIDDVEYFDAAFFGLPPSEAEKMDPQIRILLECVWEAFETAGYNPDEYPRLIGAYFGANDNFLWLRHLEAETTNTSNIYDGFTLNLRDYVATRVSYSMNLRGPSLTTLTACSTSLVTIHQACRALINKECDMAVAGGVSLTFPVKSGYIHQEGLMVSPDSTCRTFDAKANGTVFSDGLGVVVLKPLEAAIKDNDNIIAIIKGTAINNDGFNKVSYTAPSIEGQKNVITSALNSAGLSPKDISYIETHGTATKTGDPIEYEALKQAYNSAEEGSCFLGSLKPNIGHTNVASGVASFIKAVLIVKNRMVPPLLHFKSINPEINTKDSPFTIPTKRHEIPKSNTPLRAGISAFGFGGTNAHVVIEEAPLQKENKHKQVGHTIIISAKTKNGLEKQAKNLVKFLEKDSKTNLLDIAYTLCTGRKHFQFRFGSYFTSRDEAILALKNIKIPNLPINTTNSAVLMFPGQGSQYVNMGRELYKSEPYFRQNIDSCCKILMPILGLDIKDILFPEDINLSKSENILKQTFIAQPAIFIISYSIAQLLLKRGVKPKALIGHSIGEYVAACIAGVFSLEDALFIVAGRGKLIQQLPEGTMLALSLPKEEVEKLLDENISLAAINGQRLCVVSGEKSHISKFEAKLIAKGIEYQSLYTSHAFHSEMMELIHDEFLKLFDGITLSEPKTPIMSTVTGDWIDNKEIAKPAYWFRNMRQTVCFADAIQKILETENNILVEAGPGQTLRTLALINSKRPSNTNVLSTLSTRKDNQNVYTALTKLWQAGIKINWNEFYKDIQCSTIALPTYPFERQKFNVNISETAPKDAPRSLDKKTNIDDWFYVQSWKRSIIPLKDNKKTNNQHWLLFANNDEISSSLINKLQENNQEVSIVYPGANFVKSSKSEFSMNVLEYDHYKLLFEELINDKHVPDKILSLWSVSNHTDNSDFDKKQYQNQEFYSLLFLAQIIGKNNITNDLQICVISNNLYNVTGSEQYVDIRKSSLLGPVKVIPQEFPNINCCSIDIEINNGQQDNLNEIADYLYNEVISNSQDIIIAYRNNYRWTQHYEQIATDKSNEKSKHLRQKGVYLITGGLGEIGFAFAEYLAKTVKAKIILTGRSVFPEKSDWDNWLKINPKDNQISQKISKLQEIEKYGAEVFIIQSDVADRDKMNFEVMNIAEKLGSIDGIIHAAGLPGEEIIQLKKQEKVESILAPKIQGTMIINELIDKLNPDFVLLCSSIASVLGGVGLADYCAANNFMDSYANYYGQKKECKIISVNWDMWGEIGMGLKTYIPRELKEWFDNELKNGITISEGMEVFERIFTLRNTNNIIVTTRDLQRRIALWIKREFIKERQRSLANKQKRNKYNRPDLSIDYTKPKTKIEKQIAEVWENLFAIDKIGRNDNFYEIGGHSLLATILASELQKKFSKSVSIRNIMDFPTVSELAQLIQEK